jgi:polyribonucleotide nucleotidyltransferase
MNFPTTEKTVKIKDKEISFSIGKLAPQANAAVLARTGDTLVLATVITSEPREDFGYFPLFVEYQEKLYAGGIIKGSRWVKREGRPSDEAILTARLIDRSIRPFFPKGFKNEVQVIITVLSFDGENDPDILAINAASAALAISDIPWSGPVGAVRIGFRDNSFFANPVYQELEFSDLDLIISGTENKIAMIESGANEVQEEQIISGLEFGLESIKTITESIKDLQKKIGSQKIQFKTKQVNAQLKKKIENEAKSILLDLFNQKDSVEKADFSTINELKKALIEKFEDEPKSDIEKVIDEYFKQLIRENVLKNKKRLDGRKLDEIRKIDIDVGVLPRTHGSVIFQRGLTQALTITTLGSPSLEQWIEGMEGEETKRYIHHYYMPPYSVGETGRLGWPSRREVGHGALAERALLPVLPSEEKFPYTIRVVSEITSSNGSTSMASVCGSSLSLMDAGVPIKKPVAGIAMGLVMSEANPKNYSILTDILGLEDHIGDMDFKVAGTKNGVTALQMDVKVLGIESKILVEGLKQAKKARLDILNKMDKILSQARTSVSQYAPKVAVIKIEKDKIGEVIGPGGRIIRQIISETGVNMDVDDEGNITVSAMDKETINKAIAWIESLTREVNVDEEFMGEVKRIQPFGAFVEILPGKEGLVHVSKMSTKFVKDPSEIVNIGDKVKVRVIEIDDMGRLNLSMLFGDDINKKQKSKRFDDRKPKSFKPKNKPSYHYDKKY